MSRFLAQDTSHYYLSILIMIHTAFKTFNWELGIGISKDLKKDAALNGFAPN